LSNSTSNFDTNEKLLEYILIPSLQYYLIVNQHKIAVTCYTKTDLGWVVKGYEKLEDIIFLAQLNIEIPLSDIYEGIDFN
jgi:Uma2 family endonuclease